MSRKKLRLDRHHLEEERLMVSAAALHQFWAIDQESDKAYRRLRTDKLLRRRARGGFLSHSHQPKGAFPHVDNIDMVLPALTPSGYVFPPTATSSTLDPNFGRTNSTSWQATSFYHALQADITKRVSHGVEVHAAYTLGKSIDTLSATAADDAFPNGLFNQLFFDQRTTRGLSDFNVAQTFVLSFTWQIPSPAAGAKFPSWALGGWQLGGLYKRSTGQPFTPILGGDAVGMKLDQTGEPPDRLGGPSCHTLTNPGNPNHFIKTECLAFPVPSNRW